MLKIEDLLLGTDMLSVVFRDTLLKIGQLSTDYIFSTSDVASLRVDIIPKIIIPIIQFTDVKIRIKDFNRLSFNVVFLLKDSSLRGVQRIIEKQETASIPPLTFDRNVLQKYHNEIDANNYQKILAFLEANRTIKPETVISMVESGLKKLKPFSNFRIELTMFDFLNSYVNQWQTYLSSLITRAYEKIVEENEQKALRLERIAQIIESKKLYYSERDVVPRLVDMRNSILLELKNEDGSSISKAEVDKFLLDKNNFSIFQVLSSRINSTWFGTYEGESYKIIYDGQNVHITENAEPLRNYTEKKIAFFSRQLQPMVIDEIRVSSKPKYDNYSFVYVLYKKKKTELIDSAINTSNVRVINIMRGALELDVNDPSYKMYKEPLDNLSDTLSSVIINELLLKSFKQHSQGSSFISKIFGLFFSSFKESEFVAMLNADKQRANSLTKQVLGVDTSRPRKPVETPVQSALKILKRSGQLQKASEILYSRSDEGLKVKEILRMCTDIGATNKAHIEKNDKAIHEFLQELKKLI